MLEQHLTQLLLDLGMGPLPPKNKEGLFFMELTPQTKVSFRPLDPGIYLFGEIAPCPKEKKEDIFAFIMRANFLGLGTGGATLALDGEEKFLTLSYALAYDTNYRNFKETVEEFVNFLDYWRDELARLSKKDE